MTTAVNNSSNLSSGPATSSGSQNQQRSGSRPSTGNSGSRRSAGGAANVDGSMNQRRNNNSRGVWSNHPSGGNGSYHGRGSYSNVNNRRSPSVDSDPSDRHLYDRLLYLLAQSLGSKIIATVRSGARYSGILSSACTQGDLGITLRLAHQISAPPGEEIDEKANDTLIGTLVIEPKDLLDIRILELNLNDQISAGFKTDGDISGRSGAETGKVRELERWQPDETEELGEALEDMSLSSSKGWDQFAVNEERFGVRSTFDEEIYTTKLDKSHPDYELRAAAAERIAREIESSSYGGNLHMAEERNAVVDDSGVDEEDKYSGVVRTKAQLNSLTTEPSSSPSVPTIAVAGAGAVSTPTSNRYIPPALRAKLASQEQQTPKEDSSSTAPARTKSENTKLPAAQPPIQNQVPQQSQNVTQTPASQVDSAILSSKINDSSKPGSGAASTLSDSKSNLAASQTTTDLTAQIPEVRRSKDIEKQVSTPGKLDSQNSVKAAALRQLSSESRERSTEFSKREQDRLLELTDFSKAFKLRTPIPADLVSILAKDKDKQEKIISKSMADAKDHKARQPLTPETMSKAEYSRPLSSRVISAQKLKADSNSNLPISVVTPVDFRPKATPSPAPSTASPSAPTTSASVSSSSASASTSTSASVPSAPAAHAVPASSPSPPARPQLTAKKLNANAAEFKPNPFASSFTPSFGAASATAARASPSPAHSTVGTPNRTYIKPAGRAETPSFFPQGWIPPEGPRASINEEFNPFIRAKDTYSGTEEFTLPKAFITPPIWDFFAEEQSQSYMAMFVVQEPSVPGNVRLYPVQMVGQPMPFSPVPGHSMPSVQGSPSVSGPGSPYVSGPVQSDESMRLPVMGNGTPVVNSPHMLAPAMMAGPSQFNNSAAAMYPYPAQYYGGRQGISPGAFMNGPTMTAPGGPHYGSYVPQPSPPQGYGSPGRNNHQPMMMPGGVPPPQGPYGAYPQSQMFMMRGPPMHGGMPPNHGNH
ncbi:uncharacterized protein V1516DRAFT_687162 [Lipomyces oligophaga]|uniref:uncharacterized protein n=1 Tax=Lipomyces oligophaga TaxID=45792 RepID=UPI0034CF67A1